MPRNYKCRACGIVHPPPTGKHCRHVPEEEDDEGSDTQAQILDAIQHLQSEMVAMKAQMQHSNDSQAAGGSNGPHSVSDGGSVVSDNGARGGSDTETATTQSLRTNLRLMAQAAGRIAQLEGSDADDDDLTELTKSRKKGKKSGSLMVGTDSVEHTIAWPHMQVRRTVNGARKSLAYKELKVEEFVYGFLVMRRSPKCTMD